MTTKWVWIRPNVWQLQAEKHIALLNQRYPWFAWMDFLYFFANYKQQLKQENRLETPAKFVALADFWANYHWLRSLVKHIVAAKHGSSKPLTSNELWLLELRIKNTRILAPILDALWDMCKLSISSWCSSWCTGLFAPRPTLWKCLKLCLVCGYNVSSFASVPSALQ